LKFILGTAQIRGVYGLNNFRSKTNIEALELLTLGFSLGVSGIDTASDYVTSEETIGNLNYQILKDIEITTKLPHNINVRNLDYSETYDLVKRFLDLSLKKMNKDHIYCLMFHNQTNIDNPKLVQSVMRLKQENHIDKIGVSVYDLPYAEKALKMGFDVIQLPLNFFNRTFINFIKEHGSEIEISIRSVFLQGALLMDLSELEKKFPREINWFAEFNSLCSSNNISKLELSLMYIKSIRNVSSIVFGVDNESQLIEVIRVLSSSKEYNQINFINETLNDVPRTIWDPRLWES
jgi:aryl-alcohol dehydrogenase-like predicted oxidoreductase